MPSRSTLFAPVRIPKASELLAEQIRAAILVGDLSDGSPLPSEKELVHQFGVSRATVREGLRLLEAQGLIRTRPGRGGGATVCRPSARAHTRSLALLLQFDSTTLRELLEARRAIKPYCGRLAAERIRPEQLAELRAVLDEMRGLTGDRAAFRTAQIRFHLLIAQATQNPVLRIYCTSLADLIYDQIREVPLTREDLEAGTAACVRIFEALEQRDGDAAERRIARHLVAVEAAIARAGWLPGERPMELSSLVGDPRDGALAGHVAAGMEAPTTGTS